LFGQIQNKGRNFEIEDEMKEEILKSRKESRRKKNKKAKIKNKKIYSPEEIHAK
jgi:hypothetical protein